MGKIYVFIVKSADTMPWTSCWRADTVCSLTRGLLIGHCKIGGIDQALRSSVWLGRSELRGLSIVALCPLSYLLSGLLRHQGLRLSQNMKI
jgi:hypothetical protein